MAGLWYRQYGEARWFDCRLAENALGAYLASAGWTEDNQNWQVKHPLFPNDPALAFHAITNWQSIGAPAMSHQFLEGSLVMGDTANVGRTGNPDWDGTAGRSLPHHRDLPTPPIAHHINRGSTM